MIKSALYSVVIIFSIFPKISYGLVFKDSPRLIWGEVKNFDEKNITVSYAKGKKINLPRNTVGSDLRAGYWIQFLEKPVDVSTVQSYKL